MNERGKLNGIESSEVSALCYDDGNANLLSLELVSLRDFDNLYLCGNQCGDIFFPGHK